MAKDPAFLFYSQDWITGTQVLTFEERGKYIHILALMHQQGRMDEETIRFLVGSVSVKLKSKFLVDENGLWYNVKLESETEKRNEFIKSRHENGKKGGRPKKDKKPYGKPTGNHMGNENEDVIDNVKSNKEGVRGEKFLIPQMWEVWKSVKPKYPADKKKDFEPLKKIAEFICGQERITWIPTDATETAQILEIWRTLGEYIEVDKFFKKYSLEQVERHIQSISQSFQENKPKTFKDVQNESDDYIDEMFKKSEFNGR